MLDQAHDLRRLATERGRPKADRAVERPTCLAVIGGKGGVGATTVAIELTRKLATADRSTILVDADPAGGDTAHRCGIEERYTLADLLAGRRTWDEVIEAVPDGFGLITGVGSPDESGDGSAAALERLPEFLDDSCIAADVVVIDVGNHADRGVGRLCQMADAIVMVTTTETPAVLSTFKTIKALVQNAYHRGNRQATSGAFPLYLLVNRSQSARDVTVVQYRIHRACRRLLGVNIPLVEVGWATNWAIRRSAGRKANRPRMTAGIDPNTGHEAKERLNIGATFVDTLREPRAREVVLN